jgi:hypothetical protein
MQAWRLWSSENSLFSANAIGGRGWIGQLHIRIGQWRIGRRLSSQMKPRLIIWG